MMKRGRGRPPKEPGKKFRQAAFRLPPDLMEELEALVPVGERSRFIREAIEAALAGREPAPGPGEPAPPP
jgi:metal-responsive CopG/Arc/MetJ family transcriptional regulator